MARKKSEKIIYMQDQSTLQDDTELRQIKSKKFLKFSYKIFKVKNN